MEDPDIIANYDKMPEELKWEWVDLIYGNNDRFNAPALERIIKILGNPAINIPSRERSMKTLAQLKALAETMNKLEQSSNFLLRQVLNGGDNRLFSEILNNMTKNSKHENKSFMD
jgi:hypothetical protein